MYFLALIADYDGTIAHHSTVDAETLNALERVKQSGRKLVLITGRNLPDLKSVFPAIGIFDIVVAENGALLYNPRTREETALAPAPPPDLVDCLKKMKVEPLAIGRTIVATWEPHENVVLKTIRELGLEHQIIFNKGAVMVLPPNVNKASGLSEALRILNIAPQCVVGVGDAENDHAFLLRCGCAVAVSNAIDAVKQKVDWVTERDHGAGVQELVDRLIDNDLRDIARSFPRHSIMLGTDMETNEEIALSPYFGSTLICGISGGGKSTTVTGLLESMTQRRLQSCVIDPEGDYGPSEDWVVLGDSKAQPQTDDVLELLRRPGHNVVVNMLAFSMPDRPLFFMRLLPDIVKQRARSGRPQWLVIDEAHHMLPTTWEPAIHTLPQDLPATLMVTVHPAQLSKHALATVNAALVVGKHPDQAFAEFSEAIGEPIENVPGGELQKGTGYFWRRGDRTPRLIKLVRPVQDRKRHARKYARGHLEEDLQFFFRGPHNRLKLRAQNLSVFLQMAEGVDDETWQHHLKAGDYSRWFRETIKDKDLADEAEAVEQEAELAPEESRTRIREIVDRRYTGPASEQ